ncbi:MAG: hypothetical protein JXB05_21590, partial [Myxococcaceae bacterium]|nr:hypothetical protein [Myxococcaceae bacterium]
RPMRVARPSWTTTYPGPRPQQGSHAAYARALYSSIRWNITGSKSLIVRQWLNTQSYVAQRKFGLLALENVTKGIW